MKIASKSSIDLKREPPEKIATHYTPDPRETMRTLPTWMQPFLTWLVGKPYIGQKYSQRTPYYHFLTALVAMLTGCMLTALGFIGSGFFLIFVPIGWLLTVSGARKFQAMIVHQCAHGNFSHRKSTNYIAGCLISSILLLRDFSNYRADHGPNHHGKAFLTHKDETVKFLFTMCHLAPAMRRRECWRKLLISFISPRFHLRFLATRIISCFSFESRLQGFAAAWFYIALAISTIALDILPLVLATWLFPLVVLYQISTTLRLSNEHVWPDAEWDGRINKKYLSKRTFGIFLGDAIPRATLSPIRRQLSWLLWFVRLLFIHIPARLFVMIGDTSCHDYHHRFPNSIKWPNSIFARHEDSLDSSSRWAEPYAEVWGVVAACNLVFDSLARLPADSTGASSDTTLRSVYGTNH